MAGAGSLTPPWPGLGAYAVSKAALIHLTTELGYQLGPDVGATGTVPVSSVIGELPLTGLLVARAYELAVHTLDLALMVAGTKYRGQFEERIKAVMNEVRRAKNVVNR